MNKKTRENYLKKVAQDAQIAQADKLSADDNSALEGGSGDKFTDALIDSIVDAIKIPGE
jgi:hypothetical protein